MQEICSEVVVQMKDHTFNGKNSTSVELFSGDSKRAYVSSRLHDGATVIFFREFMKGLALASIEARLTLLSNDAHRYKGLITAYAEVESHLLQRYAIDAVIVKAHEEILSFKQH